jgi:ubiquinone/menaquinone biosynthesis C-methylase UbiE
VCGLWRAFLRLFFRLLYNQLAWSYDVVAWLVSLGDWKAWGRTTLAHLCGERVLDLGHGPGHLLVAMAERGLAPVGLDLSPHMGRQAQRRMRRAELTVPLLRARAQALPFPTASLDSVVATFPTEFIVDPRTLREVTRALRPGGRLIVAVWVRFEGTGLMARFLRGLYRATGQNEPAPDAFKPWLKEMGLSPRVVWERVGRTAVMLVVAERGKCQPSGT